ncbi:MAG: lytic murein transglycosylase [Rhizobiaceae bacterium]
MLKKSLSVLVIALLAMAMPAKAANLDAQFRDWLENDLWQQAGAQGISRQTFDASLSGVALNLDLPDLVIPGKKPKVPQKQLQAEFSSPAAYFAEKTISPLVSGGKARAGQHAKTLKAIERKYGVPGSIILAIWGRESGFGAAQGKYPVFNVLATKAFMSTRKDLFQKELLAALKIVEKGYATPDMMKVSWAGAMGQPQFLPSSYLDHAVDFDGDGRRDIWNSVPDTLASIANYLTQFGWQSGRSWGAEVLVPDSISCALEGPDQGRPLSEWTEAGVARANGKAFAKGEAGNEQLLLAPAGRSGPMFMATANFYVIKNYNISDLYALFIGHVADRINGGAAGFAAPWGKVSGLSRGDIAAMQNRLVALGYDVGKADGLPGFKTRRSIGDWQAKNGLPATCFPDVALKKVLK